MNTQPNLTLFLDYAGTSREMLRGNARYLHELRKVAAEVYGRVTLIMATMGCNEPHKNLALFGFDGMMEIGGSVENPSSLHVWQAQVKDLSALPDSYDRQYRREIEALTNTMTSDGRLEIKHLNEAEKIAFIEKRRGDKLILVDDDLQRVPTKISAYSGIFNPTDRGARWAGELAQENNFLLDLGYVDFDRSPKWSPENLLRIIGETVWFLDHNSRNLAH